MADIAPSKAQSDITQNTAVDDTASIEPVPSSPPKVTLNGRPKPHKQTTSGSTGMNIGIDVSDYFIGPRDVSKHSKWPTFMRIHGSILPEMILPMLFMVCWSVTITVISELVWNLGVSEILLTILGFVVGLGLSFRGSTAYERYIEGRKQWTDLMQISQTMGRTIWQHTTEREGELGKHDLLAKMSAMNLIYAFSVALKHRLRFEPYQHYEDLEGLVGHLDTFARAADSSELAAGRRKGPLKRTGEYLGVSFAESNPRKELKKARKPVGNLPLEILSYLGAYIDSVVDNGTLSNAIHQSTCINGMNKLNEVLTNTDRVLNTPLPLAYSIAISQMTWIYVIVLPFQLYNNLGWLTIPGSVVGSYIILALALIGNEIENPDRKSVV